MGQSATTALVTVVVGVKLVTVVIPSDGTVEIEVVVCVTVRVEQLRRR